MTKIDSFQSIFGYCVVAFVKDELTYLTTIAPSYDNVILLAEQKIGEPWEILRNYCGVMTVFGNFPIFKDEAIDDGNI